MPRLTEAVRRGGRGLRWGAAAIAVAMLLAAPGLHAYYDDVHYALTYYIARQSGFTPLQAFRIASANVSVDYDPNTEPVQPTAQKLQLIGIKEGAQRPRWKFHAFRNELEFPGTAGRGVDAEAASKIGDADSAIRTQQDELWNRALTFMHQNAPLDAMSFGANPGVFLHFFMDKEPHAKYGSAWGHWPLDPEFFPRAIADKLPIGGTTDWVGFRSGDVGILIEQTAGWLGQFMQKVSPLQQFRPYQTGDYTQVLRQLSVPPPAPIDTPLKRELYARYFGLDLPFGSIPPSASAPVIADLASELKGQPPADFDRQRRGPDVGNALAAINAALKNAGMDDSIPRQHFPYPLNTNGDLQPPDPETLDKWVLVGSLKVRVLDDRNGARVPFDGGTVSVKLAKLRRDGQDVLLGQPKSIGAGETALFEPLPVGDLIIEVRDRAGAGRGRTTITLERREVELELTLPPAPPSTTTYTPVRDVCVFFPDESPVDKKRNEKDIEKGGRGYRCDDSLSFDRSGSWHADIIQWGSDAEATAQFSDFVATTGEQRSTEFGTVAWVSRTDKEFRSRFRLGPFTVSVSADGQWKDRWDRLTRQVDNTLKTWLTTPGSRAGNAVSGGEPPMAKVVDTTPAPRPMPAPAPPPPPPTTRPTRAPAAVPAPVPAPTAAPRAGTSAACAQLQRQRADIAGNIQSVTRQIAETTVQVRANALKRRLAELQQEDQNLAQQELASCR